MVTTKVRSTPTTPPEFQNFPTLRAYLIFHGILVPQEKDPFDYNTRDPVQSKFWHSHKPTLTLDYVGCEESWRITGRWPTCKNGLQPKKGLNVRHG